MRKEPPPSTEPSLSQTQEPVSSTWKEVFGALLGGMAGAYTFQSASGEEAREALRYLLDPTERLKQAGLGVVDVGGDIVNISQILRDPSPEFGRINALNALIDRPGTLPEYLFVSSGDPFGENDIVPLTNLVNREHVREIRDNGGFLSPEVFHYEPLFPSNNPLCRFIRWTTTHAIEIRLLLPLFMPSLGFQGALVLAHGIIDFYHAEGTFSDKMLSGLSSAAFARYAEPIFHLPHNPFELEHHLIDQIEHHVAEFVMEGLLHQVNHGWQHLVHNVVHHPRKIYDVIKPKPVNIGLQFERIIKDGKVYLFPKNLPVREERQETPPQRLYNSFPLVFTPPSIQLVGFTPSFYDPHLFPQTSPSSVEPHFSLDPEPKDPSFTSTSPLSSQAEEIPEEQVPTQSGEIETIPSSVTSLKEQVNVGNSKTTKSSVIAESGSLGNLKLDIHPIPHGVYVGAISTSDIFGFNAGIGFEVDGIDNAANQYLNRVWGDHRLSDKYIELCGERYKRKFRSIGGFFNSYDAKLTLRHVKSGEEKTKHFKLKAFDFGSEENEPIIRETFQEIASSFINQFFERDKNVFINNCNEALSRNDYSGARYLCREFFDKYSESSEFLSKQHIARIIDEAEKEYRISTSTQQELIALSEAPEFVDAGSQIKIKARLDIFAVSEIIDALEKGDFATANNECDKINNGELQKDQRNEIARSLFSLVHQQYKSAKTPEELGAAEKGFRRVLEIDPTHRGAIEQLGNCYLSQQKYDTAIDWVEKTLLVDHPEDSFGLCIKAAGQFGNDEIKEGRKTLNRVLAKDPGNQFVHRVMARSYAEEATQLQQAYWQAREDREEGIVFALDTRSSEAIPLMQTRIEQGEKYLAELNGAIEKLKIHAEQIKPLSEKNVAAEKNSESQCQKAIADEQLKELQQERDRAVVKVETDKKKLEVTRCVITHFKVQSAQIAADLIFYFVDHDKAPKSIQRLRPLKKPVAAGLQLAAHHYWWEKDAASRTGIEPSSVTLNRGRYVLLGAEFGRALLGLFESDQRPRLKKLMKVMDQRGLPIGQLMLSVGIMVANPKNFVGGALAFNPTLLLNIPEAQEFLLKPNPKSKFAPTRLMLGKALERITQNNVNKSTAAQIIKGAGFVAAYSETLLAWLRRAFSAIGMKAVLAIKVAEIFVSLCNCYLFFKAGQLGWTLYQAHQDSDQNWNQHCFELLQYQYHQGMQILEAQTPQANSLFFKKIKEDLRCLFFKIKNPNSELRKLYILSLYFEYLFSGAYEFAETPEDGNSLFHAISCYLEQDYCELRQMAVEYERTHRQEFIEKKLISRDFEEHVRKMVGKGTKGGDAEIHALSQVLNRPIIVVSKDKDINVTVGNLSYDLSELTDEPIFVELDKGKQHYRAILLRGENYFEDDYTRSMAAKGARKVHQPLSVTYDAAQSKIADCQQKLAKIKRSLDSLDTRLTLFSDGEGVIKEKSAARTIYGVTFFGNTGLSREEEISIAAAIARMTN